MMSDMPLPMPRSVICSPSHIDERRPGREGQHGHQTESPARVVHERQAAGDVRLVLEIQRDPERLDDGQQDRAVAGVLRNLPAPELPFLREPLEVRPTRR